jgi:hypothetical protein
MKYSCIAGAQIDPSLNPQTSATNVTLHQENVSEQCLRN